jgi:dienelactone hydrolase
MKWIGEREVGEAFTTQEFELSCEGRRVPGLFWAPSGAAPRALALLGHGASTHKRAPYLATLASRLVGQHGFAAAAIDGPVHGARRSDAAEGLGVRAQFREAWQRPETLDEMVADWKATLAALRALPGLADVPVGYWGLSMGTILGLPLVAAEPRIRAAVLGLCGIVPPSEERFARDAEQIRIPILFIQQWDDELFPRARVHALYDRIASREKTLHANPGLHGEVPPREFAASVQFLAAQLTDAPRARDASERA